MFVSAMDYYSTDRFIRNDELCPTNLKGLKSMKLCIVAREKLMELMGKKESEK